MKKTELSPNSASKITKAEVKRADLKAKVLDKETTDTLNNVAHKNSLAVRWFVICWTILFVVGVVGIVYQNQIARSNKSHIDCIVKLLATPASSGQTRHIANLSTCQIKVSS